MSNAYLVVHLNSSATSYETVWMKQNFTQNEIYEAKAYATLGGKPTYSTAISSDIICGHMELAR